MITAMIRLQVKPHCLNEFKIINAELTKATQGVRKGCINYMFLQDQDNPYQFVLFEQWQDQAAIDGHIEYLVKKFGDPLPGQALPEKLVNLYESSEIKFYQVLGQ